MRKCINKRNLDGKTVKQLGESSVVNVKAEVGDVDERGAVLLLLALNRLALLLLLALGALSAALSIALALGRIAVLKKDTETKLLKTEIKPKFLFFSKPWQRRCCCCLLPAWLRPREFPSPSKQPWQRSRDQQESSDQQPNNSDEEKQNHSSFFFFYLERSQLLLLVGKLHKAESLAAIVAATSNASRNGVVSLDEIVKRF